jgi:predicted TIM-barrel fold metal-dependent hydrolase
MAAPEQGGADLYLFSTDYPHPEGTKDPIGRFEATMAGVSEAERDAFYTDNFAALYHGTVPVGG